MFLNFLFFLLTTSFIQALCPYPELENGRIRHPKRWMIRYSCRLGFDLVGNRYATCRGGKWDEPPPVCVKSGCEVPDVKNSFVMKSHKSAWLQVFCLPGYNLVGSSFLYCNGVRWNGTTPSCAATKEAQKLSCDFEDSDLCGWTQDEFHDFDWKRINKKTPSSFLFTGPSFDHTYGAGKLGYYMYIESTSRAENQSARLLSPMYDGDITDDACFVFYYHMYGESIGGLRVYQKPETFPLHLLDYGNHYKLFERWGSLNDFWYSSVTPLKKMTVPFQIVIEGIRGRGFTSDIAIDDVAIMHGANCTEANRTASTPPTFLSESCADRCDIFETNDVSVKIPGLCSCTYMCITDDNCCPDFMELCVYNNISKSDDDTTSYQSETQKLIAKSTPSYSTTMTTKLSTIVVEHTTTTKPTTITKPTTTTTKPTTTTTSTTSTTTTTTSTTTPSTSTTTKAPEVKIISEKPAKTDAEYVEPITPNIDKTATTRTNTITRAPASNTSRPLKPSVVVTRTTTTLTPSSEFISYRSPTILTPPTPKPTTTTVRTARVTPQATTVKQFTDGRASTSLRSFSTKTPEATAKSTLIKEIKQSGWSGLRIFLVILATVACFCGLVYAVISFRSSHGRLRIARLRGSLHNDSEVHYLNSAADED